MAVYHAPRTPTLRPQRQTLQCFAVAACISGKIDDVRRQGTRIDQPVPHYGTRLDRCIIGGCNPRTMRPVCG
jgi:hypothetical protein